MYTGWLLVTQSEHKGLQKYTKVGRDRGGVEVMSRIDLALAKKDMLRSVQGVRAVRGMGRRLNGRIKEALTC